MLSPKKQKHRKQMRGRVKGIAYRGSTLEFGDYGLRAMTPGYLDARQIEAARICISRYCKRVGKMWIRIFPDKPYTSKPIEVRMGKGKGSPEKFVCPVKQGRVLYEISGVPKEVAMKALKNAAYKLPLKTKTVERKDSLWT